jgi:hypothetical protein
VLGLTLRQVGGLIVTQLRPTGAGALAGLKIGDLITYAGTKQLNDVAELDNGQCIETGSVAKTTAQPMSQRSAGQPVSPRRGHRVSGP